MNGYVNNIYTLNCFKYSSYFVVINFSKQFDKMLDYLNSIYILTVSSLSS